MSTDSLRFGFGKNWSDFIEKNLSEKVIAASVDHMKRFMKRDSLAGLRILDIGCGSGIHSLAMRRLGAAEVVAFDYDFNSVETSKKVRAWSGDETGWHIEEGSVLDTAYLVSLGKFDVVYSWGVLHHTGEMWNAVRNAMIPLKPDGEFYIALYSSDTYVDPSPEEWIRIKKDYNYASPIKKKWMELSHFYKQVVVPEMKSGHGLLSAVSHAVKNYGSRGMNIWVDIRDWLGGYPMEFAGLHETRDFVVATNRMTLVNVLNGEGCTEYIFADLSKNQHWAAVHASRALVALEGPFQHSGGHGFIANLPHLAAVADDNGHNMRSSLMLFEDGMPLGLTHCLHDVIRARGAGRFSHWQGWLVFSASDNTDPNVNGRSYSYCVDF